MGLVETIKNIGKKGLIYSLILKSLAFGYDNIKSVTINGLGNIPAEKVSFILPNVSLYHTFKTKGISDDNIFISSNKTPFTSFPAQDYTAGWSVDDIWLGNDLFIYPDTVKFDKVDNQVTAKSFLDDIININSTSNDLVFIYLMGHGSLNTQPKDTYMRVATSAGATTWQGLPLDSGKVFHYHMNKALSMINFKRCIILTDACNSYSLAQYINKDKNLNNTNLQNVIVISASRRDLDGIGFGHYFAHLSRTGETIKRAVEITDSLNGIEQADILYFGNQTELSNFTANYNLFEDTPTTALKPITKRQSTARTGIEDVYNLKGQLIGRLQNQKNNQKILKFNSNNGIYITKIRD